MKKVKQIVKQKVNLRSVPGAIRTLDPLLRRQLLCPTELQGQAVYYPNVARGERKVKIVITVWLITITTLAPSFP